MEEGFLAKLAFEQRPEGGWKWEISLKGTGIVGPTPKYLSLYTYSEKNDPFSHVWLVFTWTRVITFPLQKNFFSHKKFPYNM